MRLPGKMIIIASRPALGEFEKQEETSWLREVNSKSLQTALRSIETAYRTSPVAMPGFPGVKSKRRKNSFSVPQHNRLIAGRVLFLNLRRGSGVFSIERAKGMLEK